MTTKAFPSTLTTLRVRKDRRYIPMLYSEQLVLTVQVLEYGQAVDLSDTDTELATIIESYGALPVDNDGAPSIGDHVTLTPTPITPWTIEKVVGTGGRFQVLIPDAWADKNPEPNANAVPTAMCTIDLKLADNRARDLRIPVTARRGVTGRPKDDVRLPIPALQTNLIWDIGTNELTASQTQLEDIHLTDVTPEASNKTLTFLLTNGSEIVVNMAQFFTGAGTGDVTTAQLNAEIEARKQADIDNQRVVHDQVPSADTLGKLIYREGDQQFYRTISIGQFTPAKATFSAYSDAAFKGNFAALADMPDANAAANQGTWGWVYGELQAYRSIRNAQTNQFEWVDVDVDRIVAGADYIGHYATDELATPHVTRSGDLYNDDTNNVLKQADTFTPASGTPVRYEQDRMAPQSALNQEIANRHTAGVMLHYIIESEARFAPTFRTFSGRGNPAIFEITAGFTTALKTYIKGDFFYASPGASLESHLVQISRGDSSSGGSGLTPEQAAAIAANTKLSSENKTRLDAIPHYAATMEVWPPNVAQHSDFQRKFQSTLSGLDDALATNAGSTGTRFTNTFRIFTRLSDGTVVQLHTQGWAFTEDGRQTIEWEVDATEFNALGTSSATNGLEVWGEFRAVYGGGVNESRGRTNPFFIDFGEQDEWPATRGDLLTFQPKLSLAQEIGLLNFTITPGGITFTDADDLAPKVKTFRINVTNPEVLTGDAWVLGYVLGQPAMGARTKVSSSTSGIDIVLSDASSRQVASALISNGDSDVEVRLRFYDAESAGNEIERVGDNIPIVELSSDGGATPGRRLRINASGASNRTIQLPADFTTYDIVLLETADGNEFSFDLKALPTTGTREYRSGGSARVTWTASTRQFIYSASSFRGATLYEAGTSAGTSYTLPAASSSTRGGVLGITNAIIDTGTSTGYFAWAISHVRRLAQSVVNAAISGFQTAAQVTTIANARALARYTDAEKAKLAGVEAGAQKNVGVQYTQAEKDKLSRLNNLLNHAVPFAVRTAFAIGDLVIYNGHLYYVAVAVPASNTAVPADGSTWILLSADPTPTATDSRTGTVTLNQVDALINAVSGVSAKVVTQVDNSRVAGFQGLSVWYGTKAQYDAIVSKSATTIYLYPDA